MRTVLELALLRRCGSVILIVLITLMFAGVALTLFIEKASTDLLVEVRDADASRLRLEAYSALETTLGVLEDFRQVLGQLHSPSEGWGDPLGFAHYDPGAGRRVEVNFEDESAKLSLPNVDATTLTQLFVSWGLTQSKAESLRDAVMGWMHTDYVGTAASAPRAEDYDRGDLPYAPPGRSLRSFSELASILYAKDVFFDEKGQPNDLYQRFVSAFSLYSYKQPNINGGNPEVFAGLGIQDPTQARLVSDFLSGKAQNQASGSPTYFKSSQDITGLLGATSPATALGTQIKALRIFVTVHQGRSIFHLNVLVAPQGGATVPKAAATANANSTPATTSSSSGQNPPSSTPNQPAQAFPRSANDVTSTSSSDAPAANSLKYPFTILEIHEN